MNLGDSIVKQLLEWDNKGHMLRDPSDITEDLMKKALEKTKLSDNLWSSAFKEDLEKAEEELSNVKILHNQGLILNCNFSGSGVPLFL